MDAETRLPRRLSLLYIAQIIQQSHLRDGGASIHPCFGDLKGQSLYCASLYPERTVRITGRELPAELIAAYYRRNADLLEDPRLIIGTWYNAEEDTTYIDVSAVFTQRDEAVLLATTYNQWAIYDLAYENEMAVGGNGEELSEMPPEDQRLPLLRREEMN